MRWERSQRTRHIFNPARDSLAATAKVRGLEELTELLSESCGAPDTICV